MIFSFGILLFVLGLGLFIQAESVEASYSTTCPTSTACNAISPSYNGDVNFTCTTNCAPVFNNHVGTVTIIPTCDASSPSSYTAQLTVNGVSTPVYTQTCGPSITVFEAVPPKVNSGDLSNLNWTVSGAISCEASSSAGDWTGPKGTSGSDSVSPAATRNYTLTCLNASGIPASRTVTVTVPYGNISNSGCTIPLGGSTCDTNIWWNTTDFFATNADVQRDGDTINNSLNMPAPGLLQTGLGFTPTTFTLRDPSGAFSDTTIVTPSCVGGGVWTGSNCEALPEITLSANPNLVRSGSSAEIIVEVNSGLELSCELNDGRSGMMPSFTHTPPPNTASYPAITTKTLTAAQDVIVSCTSTLYPMVTNSESIRISVVPTIEER